MRPGQRGNARCGDAPRNCSACGVYEFVTAKGPPYSSPGSKTLALWVFWQAATWEIDTARYSIALVFLHGDGYRRTIVYQTPTGGVARFSLCSVWGVWGHDIDGSTDTLADCNAAPDRGAGIHYRAYPTVWYQSKLRRDRAGAPPDGCTFASTPASRPAC